MTRRSVKYFKLKRLHSRLGVTSWHLDWMKMHEPEPKRNLAIMMPTLNLTYFDGAAVVPAVEYYNPPQPIYNSKLVMTPRLYEEMKKRAKTMFDNQGESPSTCDATDAK